MKTCPRLSPDVIPGLGTMDDEAPPSRSISPAGGVYHAFGAAKMLQGCARRSAGGVSCCSNTVAEIRHPPPARSQDDKASGEARVEHEGFKHRASTLTALQHLFIFTRP